MNRDMLRGVKMAASLASEYDGSTTHPYRLGDCILSKLNVRKPKPRRNKRRLQNPEQAWMAGFAVALAEIHRWLPVDENSIRRVASDAGLTLATAKRAGVDLRDLRELKKIGVLKGTA